MSHELITTSNADRNLAAGATVLSTTPDASNPRLVYALIKLGDGTKNLDGTGGVFVVTMTVGGNSLRGGSESYVCGTAVRSALQTSATFVPAGQAVTISVTSPNAADTDVDVTAYLVSMTSPSGTRSELGLAAADLDTQLDAIAAQTDLIGPGGAILNAPVTPTGTLNDIIIGDDYLAANDRAFEWTISAPTGIAVGDATCWFGISNAGDGTGSWNIEGTITDNGATWTLSFDVPKATTGACDEGVYWWSAAVHGPGDVEITQVHSGKNRKVNLINKYT